MRAVLAAFAAYAVALGVGGVVAPDRMPLHWGLGGEPDRLGSRTRWLVENGLLGVTLLLLAALALVIAARTPVRWLNVPDKKYWSRPENTPRLRRMLTEDLALIFAEIGWLFTAFLVVVVFQARRGDLDLGWGHAVGLLIVIVVLLGQSVYRMQRRYMVAPGEAAA